MKDYKIYIVDDNTGIIVEKPCLKEEYEVLKNIYPSLEKILDDRFCSGISIEFTLDDALLIGYAIEDENGIELYRAEGNYDDFSIS